ncbi:hypothetical protein [Caudoviricetes sp.]|nr:hypothetical protein [Caudoviricetes sp.]
MNQHGLYSKAAQIIRNLQQERGTADQMVAAAKKLGVKDAELQNAGPLPEGKVTREQLAKHFEDKLPKMYVSQYGENPSFMPKGSGKRFMDLQMRGFDDKLSPDEKRELHHMMQRNDASPFIMGQDEDDGEGELHDPQYDNYQTPGGQNYRERLLTLGKRKDQDSYHSSHWTEHENVLAHIRMKDRTIGGERDVARPIAKRLAEAIGTDIPDLGSGSADYGVKNGIITPEEAATLSRYSGWRSGYEDKPGLDKKLLHVEELQSDWGQEGRDKGFYDPKKPYEVFNKKTGEVLSSHPTHSDAWDAFRAIPDDQAADLDYGRSQRVPGGPYVGNTQHWTDLALKNVLREAALGNYDGIVFTPGQAQADRYGLEKHLDMLRYQPSTGLLVGTKQNAPVIKKEGVKPEDLHGLIGRDMTERLLHPDNATDTGPGGVIHKLQGDDLKMGGEGMKGYYDNIVPKSVMRLAQQHDPAAKPGEPIEMGQYQGFHLPMTDKMKNSILDEGFPAFKRGGRVGFAQGGAPDGQDDPQARTQAGEFPDAGGVRGGAGLLQAQGETPLEGLPQSISVPLTGEKIAAGPDPRVRAVARSYMASTGMPYNPPTKYAKVDPARAKRIAAAYEDMPHNPNDPLTKASYDQLVKETMAQYQAAKAAGFKAEFWHPDKQEDPYLASPRLAVEDVRKNHHMWVFPTLAGYGTGQTISEDEARENPMLQLTGETWNGIPVTVNDIFRAVHDYYGHAKEGVGFRHDGEENAWRAHASMFSPLARLAMTTETRGQNSWLNFGPHGEKNQKARTEDTVFAPQKMGVLPHWVHHEGAEDFMTPDDINEMMRQRNRHGRDVSKALALTRSFTKR